MIARMSKSTVAISAPRQSMNVIGEIKRDTTDATVIIAE
jgi:hypothetical protein